MGWRGSLLPVPRKLRVQYPGAIYHVMNRGDRREPLFHDDADRRRFVETLGEACGKTGWQVHAYVLMPNHFHLVVETPQANLVVGMKWLLGVYTSRFNRRHQVFGHLFSGRYKSLIVDGSGEGYLKTVCDYVHLNPARAKLLRLEQPLRDYAWSSWPAYLRSAGLRPEWLRVERLLGEYRIPKDSAAGRRVLEAAGEERRGKEETAGYQPLRRGWCYGEAAFKAELLEAVSAQAGTAHYGDELRESAEAQAERWVAAALARKGWTQEDLVGRRKGDAFKVRLARELREKTTVTVAWIARRLHMGTRGHLRHLLYWQRRRSHRAAVRISAPSAMRYQPKATKVWVCT
jgi:REP element-mobilizing transposase RayT